jgi:hypothetical protein
MESVDIQAATYYVATTGSDSNTGTTTQPFRTISRGLSFLKLGDTLYIRAGTYAENIDSNKQSIPTGTYWTDAPLISGYPGETVILNGVINLPHDYIQYVRFERLTLNGGYQNISVGGSAHHIKFADLEVKNGTHQCVQLGQFTHDVWFTGGKVHDCGMLDPDLANSGYPFYIGGNDHLVENIEVYNSNRFCMHIFYSFAPFPNRVTVRNSIFHHCSLKENSTSAILLSKGDSNSAYNNVIYSTNGHGIMTYGGDTNSKIYNNTVYGGAQVGIYVKAGSSNTEVRNNISYMNATTQILNQGTGTILSKNQISDPRFVNASSFDFSLQTSSPAIDAGEIISMVSMDIKKTPRPQGAAHDIGAFESNGSSMLAPSPPRNLSVR